jgi:hypothetical protein
MYARIWNFDRGKTAYVKPLTKFGGEYPVIRNIGILITVGPFGDLPGRGEAREYVLGGSSNGYYSANF